MTKGPKKSFDIKECKVSTLSFALNAINLISTYYYLLFLNISHNDELVSEVVAGHAG